MTAMMRVLAGLLLAVTAGSVVFNALAYGAAAAYRRHAPAGAFADQVGPWPARLGADAQAGQEASPAGALQA